MGVKGHTIHIMEKREEVVQKMAKTIMEEKEEVLIIGGIIVGEVGEMDFTAEEVAVMGKKENVEEEEVVLCFVKKKIINALKHLLI